MRSILLITLCAISFPCISQDIFYKMTELFSLRESIPLTMAFLAGKGFKKTGEKNGTISLTNKNETFLLIKKDGMINIIDYETTDTSTFHIWIKDMTKVTNDENPIYAARSEEFYYQAMLYKSKACFSINEMNAQ